MKSTSWIIPGFVLIGETYLRYVDKLVFVLDTEVLYIMADSSITKKALANALKRLMEDIPFSKISIGDICEKCQMNRKSFYYHFKDKYDLVNWIFDTEFLEFIVGQAYQTEWDKLTELFKYFYENRSFYRKVFGVKGQNSIEEHFRDILQPVVRQRLDELMGDKITSDFQMNFLVDGFIGALQRWITDINANTYEEITKEFKLFIQCVTGSSTTASST